MQPNWEPFLTWLSKNRGRAIGAALGFAIGLLVILLGFWRGLFLAACVWAGWMLGSRVDAHESLTDLINRLLPPGE
ncbi:MAG: DUF2273 domain-containing protein [Bacillota bacterium]|nr:DUF2273 domain-containing protein [Bacillota bacterium]